MTEENENKEDKLSIAFVSGLTVIPFKSVIAVSEICGAYNGDNSINVYIDNRNGGSISIVGKQETTRFIAEYTEYLSLVELMMLSEFNERMPDPVPSFNSYNKRK